MSNRRKRPVARLYLHKNIAADRVKEVLGYLREHGHREPTVEHYRREVLLYLYDRDDLDLVRHRFANYVDGWADLRR